MNFLLLGHQRSGTSYVLDILQTHPLIDTINEPFSMHLDFFRENEEYWDEKDYDEQYLHRELKDLKPTSLYIRELDKWLNEDSVYIKGIKETGLIEKFFWLNKVIHFDKIIILIRDFRAISYSVLRRRMDKSWWNYSGRLIQYYGYDKSIVQDEVHVTAALIKERMHYIENIINTYPCYVIKLEDLIDYPKESLQKLMDYIGIEMSQRQFDFMKETSTVTRDSAYSNFRTREQVIDAWKTGLSIKNKEKIESILLDELQKFGYL